MPPPAATTVAAGRLAAAGLLSRGDRKPDAAASGTARGDSRSCSALTCRQWQRG